MTEEVRISADGTSILVFSAGLPCLDEMKRTLATIVELRRTHGIDNIFVDSRGRVGQPETIDLYQGGEMLSQQLGADARVAVLVRKLVPEHGFFENVAVNRGASVAFFEDEQAALEWLSTRKR
jgi:hypothetical protein